VIDSDLGIVRHCCTGVEWYMSLNSSKTAHKIDIVRRILQPHIGHRRRQDLVSLHNLS
jgi:hypothetical protein